MNFNEIKDQETNYDEKLLVKRVETAWNELMGCSSEEIKFTNKNGEFHVSLEVLEKKLDTSLLHVFKGEQLDLYPSKVKIDAYPTYLYYPSLRVLNKRDSEYFPQALEELEKIITKGDLTFTDDFRLGYSGFDNMPFLLSSNKERVLIILADKRNFEPHKEKGILSQDGFVYIVFNQMNGKSYPVIMIDIERLEASHKGKQAEIIEAYQKDILELFAYTIMEEYHILNDEGKASPNLKRWPKEDDVTSEHRNFAIAFAKRYMDNK